MRPDDELRGPQIFLCRRAFLDRAGRGRRKLVQIITPQQLGWTNISTATLVDAPFDWRAGLRVGAGVQRNDGFDMTLYYTNLHTSATSQASGEVYSAFMGNFYIDNTDGADYGPHYHQASIFWDFDFHTIDFEIGRNYAIGTNLELRPFLGLKTAIINQTIKSNWRDPIDTVSRTVSHIYTFHFRNRGFEFGVLGNRSFSGRDDHDALVLQGSLQPQTVRHSVGRDHVRTLDIQRTVQQQPGPDADVDYD